MPVFRSAAPCVLLLLAALAAARPAAAGEIAAVLSSKAGPYDAAYKAFAAALGREVPVVTLPRRLPDDGTRVIVAFGGEAALQAYPKGTIVIACLAPGLADWQPRVRDFAIVTMRPAPERLLSELKRLQPGLSKLGVLMQGAAAKLYIEGLERAGAIAGVKILSPPADGKNGVPGALRALSAAGADAVWLSPNPNLVTPENFQTITQFSWDHDVPFYAPTRGLAVAGAAASVFVAHEEQGRAAADVARRALAGEAVPHLVHPAGTRIAVNRASAAKAGLKIVIETLGAGVEALP